MSRPRVLFVIPTLHVGGTQRVFTNLLNGLSGQGVDLHLATVHDGPFRDQLSREVRIHVLRGGRAMTALPRLCSLIRRLRPEAVVTAAFRMNLGVMLMRPALPGRTRYLIREVSLFDSQLPQGWRGRALRALAACAFRQADLVVCQSDFMADELRQSLGLPAGRMRTIFNPVSFEDIAQRAAGDDPFPPELPGPRVLGVGRLSREKGFDRLLSAFPALCERRPGSQLWILGDGAERPALVRQAEQLGIASRVHLPGVQDNPYRWMRHADLMVVPSRHEGMPNSALEAIACECPLVVLDHPGGTREMMRRTGQESRVVDDLSAWDDAWFSPPERSARERARGLFSADFIVRQYLDAMRLYRIETAEFHEPAGRRGAPPLVPQTSQCPAEGWNLDDASPADAADDGGARLRKGFDR